MLQRLALRGSRTEIVFSLDETEPSAPSAVTSKGWHTSHFQLTIGREGPDN